MNPVQSPPTSGRRTLLLLVAGALLLTLGWTLTEAEAATPEAATAATINGKVITVDEVAASAKAQIEDLDKQRQAAEEQMKAQIEAGYQEELKKRLASTLDQMLEEQMLALESKATSKTGEQLVAENVKTKVAAVTDADVDAYYTQLQSQSQRQGKTLPAKEAIAGQIKAYLQQQAEQTARAAYFLTLRTKYKVEVNAPRVEIATEGHPAKGPADAPVTIVEFSDFECPFCKQVVPTLDQVKQKYGDKVRIVFRQFPLPPNMHPNAQKAAEAALCAQEQGKFWEMHDAMFNDPKALQVTALKATAEKLGVDKVKFDACLDSGRLAQKVRDDQKAGAAVGVNSTPSLFVNGRQLDPGAVPLDVITQVVEEELARAKSGKG